VQKENTKKKMLQNKPLPNLFGKPMKNLLQNKVSQTLLKKSQIVFTKQSFTKAYWTNFAFDNNPHKIC
jgi:hypothetical protein